MKGFLSCCEKTFFTHLFIALLAIVCIDIAPFQGIARLWAQEPPGNDTSDSNGNTGSGTGALASVTTSAGDNSAFGDSALASDTGGSRNTAVGYQALEGNTSGNNNVAEGYQSALNNQTGHDNVAVGYQALLSNLSGYNDTAVGSLALFNGNSGTDNTAVGTGALYGSASTNGFSNVAEGYNALYSNGSGHDNMALGWEALYTNSSGYNNTGNGSQALWSNDAGIDNVADGVLALFHNTGGSHNTGSGVGAMYLNTTGSSNIAVGKYAGYNLSTGSLNIDIGNQGVAGESNTIRLGTQGTQTATYIAGIAGAPVESTPVCASSAGRLGPCAMSSARFKREIHDMGGRTEGLMKLRPVTFRYKEQGGVHQYGLVAEEVERVYPELVIYDAEGRAQSVMYQALPAMLLNEVQRLVRENQRKDAEIAELQRRLDNFERREKQFVSMGSRRAIVYP